MSARVMTPRWLQAIIVKLGEAEYDQPSGGHRWVWLDGDAGVRIDHRTNAWVVFAWSPMRSASLRCAQEPSAADMANTASLAGLCGPGVLAAPTAVKFAPGVASVAGRRPAS